MAIKVEPQPETAALTGSEEEAFGIPFWPPFRLAASGLYTWRFPIFDHSPGNRSHCRGCRPSRIPGPGAAAVVTEACDGQSVDTATSALFPILSERIRLDVDGRYPQMVVSGDMSTGLFSTVHWIANLTKTGSNSYIGAIWYRDPPVAPFPYDSVKVTTGGGWLFDPRTATVVFTGPGGIQRTRTYAYTSPYFHDVDLEVDFQDGVTPATSFATCSHPNRPATLPCETLTIDEGLSARRLQRHVHAERKGPRRRRRGERDLEQPGDARRDAGLLVALRRNGAVGDLDLLRVDARHRPRPRRDHVRRHRPAAAPGHVDLHRLLHLGSGARGRSGARGVHRPHAVLDRRSRDGPHVQPRARLAEVAHLGRQWSLAAARRRARVPVVHELPVLRRRRHDGILRRLRVPVQRPGAAVHAPRACELRGAGQRPVVRPSRLHRCQRAAGADLPARSPREP